MFPPAHRDVRRGLDDVPGVLRHVHGQRRTVHHQVHRDRGHEDGGGAGADQQAVTHEPRGHRARKNERAREEQRRDRGDDLFPKE